MPRASNFATVRRRAGNNGLSVSGISQDAAAVTAVHVLVVPLLPDAGAGTRGEVVDDDAAVQGAATEGIGEQWAVVVSCDTTRFPRGTAVLLAGTALRDGAEPDLWVQTAIVIDQDDPVP